jgi:hypothetical protein
LGVNKTRVYENQQRMAPETQDAKKTKKPTVEQRIEWHLAHAKNCGCRKIEGKLADEMKRRGIAIPIYRDSKTTKT